MFKIGQIIFVFSALLVSTSLSYANADFTPLLDAKSSEIINLDSRLSSAKSALNAGLYRIAESITKKIIETDPQNKEAKYILIDAFLGQAKFNSAKKLLADFDGDINEEIYLKRAIVSIALADYSRAEFFLTKINPRRLSGDDLSWFYLSQAFTAKANKNPKLAQDYFDLVLRNTDNVILRNLTNIYNYQSIIESLASGIKNPDSSENAKESIKELLPDLEKSYIDYNNGTEVGFLFAKNYAIALYSVGEIEKAIGILKGQLESTLISESNFEELSMCLALISKGLPSQRDTLNTIIQKANSLEIVETAIYLLKEANNDKALTINNLEDLISKYNCPLKDRLLLECAYISLSLNKMEDAIKYANRLLSEYPASRYLVNATGVLAHTALQGEKIDYRLASKYLDSMSKLETLPEKSAIMKLLVADCYYLDKDYQLSALAYKELFDNEYLESYRGLILNKYLDSLLAIKDLDSASELIDKAFHSNIDRNQLWVAQWNMIRSLRKDGQLIYALNLASRALNVLEKDKDVKDILVLRVMWLKAKLCIENKEYEECISLCNRILKDSISLDESQTEFQILLNSDTMLLKARALAFTKELKGEDGAYHTFEMLRQIYPKTEAAAASFLIEASVSGTEGDLIKASSFCEQLYEAYPQSQYAPIALFEASQYLRSTGQNNSYKQALKFLSELIKNYPNSDLIFYAKISQGEMLRLLSAFNEAKNSYEDIINNFPNHNDINIAHIGLGDAIFAGVGNESKAAMQYERAYNLANVDINSKAEAGFKLGIALEKSGRIQEAQEIWHISSDNLLSKKEALQNSSKTTYWLGRTLLYLARSLELNGDKSGAIKTYNKIISNKLPGANEAKQRLIKND
ncbi:MAG: tetratricopeptide repeat protein [Opitutales bacterium]